MLGMNHFYSTLFPDFDKDTIQQLFDNGKQLELITGQYLFKQGQIQDSMYIVLKGRLRAISDNEGSGKILGDIGAGETVGELAFFTREPRMASVRAIRNSLILEFTPEKYKQIIARHPDFASSLIKLVIGRIRRNTFEINKGSAPRNVAIIDLHPSGDIKELSIQMQQYFIENIGPIQQFDSHSQAQQDWEKLFDSMEEHEGLNLLICDESDMAWTNQCVIYADLIIVAGKFKKDHHIHSVEASLDIYNQHILHKKVYLLLLHESKDDLPKNTSRWLERRQTDLHIHLRKGHLSDIHRFCRIVSNTATGLVLGGGGAKGFAHIGVVQALKESGVDIDFLGGTSAGALYGIGMAYTDFDFKKIYDLNAEAVKGKLTSRDWTLPLISLMTGKKFKRYLQKMFGNYGLEDLWINTFCLSTNLTLATYHEHRSGPLWKQVLASMAIPGVFPPVIIEKNLHVDGGVMDNLPIEPMYQYPVNTIFAVSLNSLDGREVNTEQMPSAWNLLWDKFKKNKKYRLPGIASLITNSMIINSQQKQQETKEKVSHYLELDLKGFKMLDDKNWKEIVQKGYEQTREYLLSSGYINDVKGNPD